MFVGDDAISRLFAAWGRRLFPWRWAIVLSWAVGLAIASLSAARIETVLQGGTGSIAGSPSAQAEQSLHDDFANPYAQALVLVVTSEHQTIDHPAYARFLAEALTHLRGLPAVKRVTSYADAHDARLVSADRRGAIVVIGLVAGDVGGAERAVPGLRRALQPIGVTAHRQDPTLAWHLTGRGALTHDINRFSTEDTGRAEGRSLPLTGLVLFVAFGSLVAATLPLGVGVSAIVLALGVICALTRVVEVSTLAQSVCSMLGLAMGIDYALLMVSRFREALARGLDRADAVTEAMGTAGVAVFLSGSAVAIGFGGLLFTEVLDTRSIGLGGLVVAASSVALALTLLPALLGILGEDVDAPRWLRLPRRLLPAKRFAAWAETATRRPVATVAVALTFLLVLAAPVLTLKTGFPVGQWLPTGLEYQRGFDALVGMERGGLVAPVDIVLTTDDHALAARHIPALIAYSHHLKSDERVAFLLGPVDFQPAMSPFQLLLLYADPAAAVRRYPVLGEMFVSRDTHSTYMQVFLRDGVTFEASKGFSAELAQKPPVGYRVLIGGQGAFYNDFDQVMNEAVPRVMAFVVLSTLGVLAIAFRSFLVPLKAVALNFLAVAAGLGVVVAVFQHGWGGSLVGIDHPLEQIPVTVSLSLFCIMFGLSMDYEVFMLTRIKEAYDQGADNHTAIAIGVNTTAGIVTSAAAIMVCVFGAFARAEFVIVQMLGLGLAVAVAVDATIIRLLLMPALMRLAGDWNWYPGRKTVVPKV